ncbi:MULTISPECIES: sensor histidine kinase [Micromonospora]|uniref:histidine kinase n=1 Tax=Micromonospora solifontis TaxID=2487138 RepID=A0ABX9WFG5_9ACTN|nr:MULTISPECIES: sensor histidine kinase [Micromonospora]NES15785.1 sensor histidine kinase [Micromonospora sp. PPF5-17B]NES38052.1 sensor histidine kinase [Micromonospora solifontis]NES56631.1 sensor histidine kinase [Micromonospora sp. PPF5-6]RNL97059.1 sensor histidine kinase [Micromonospora solifontis]
MTGERLLQLALRVEQDIFLVRQRGREVAAAVGLEHQDQVRVATALSEVARDLLRAVDGADVTFVLVTDPPSGRSVLRVDLAPVRPLPGGRYEPQSGAVARLVDMLGVVPDGSDTVVRMSRRIPANGQALPPERLAELRAELASSAPGTALDELAAQNAQLIAALDEVRSQRDELEVLNSELQETNRGVMALYNQLTEELEETNRGVVALYAELDEKSAQLRAASESKSRFLANVSHELRAPVTAIIGLGRLLADSASDPLTAEQARQVGLIRSSASDLLDLVNELLDLAKAESGRIEVNRTEVDLRGLFGQLRGTLRALAARPGVELVVEEPPAPATLRSDEVLLAQVLRNLLHNALKFTERGEVRLRAERRDDRWSLSVSDTGVGIPPELQERIFEEFYQVPGTTRVGGTGLGLPYARRLVALLGGTLELTSEPGRGSTFTVLLPLDGA